MIYKVSITGIDGCGKSASISEVVKGLASDYSTAKIGRPTYVSGPEINEGRIYLFSGLNKEIDEKKGGIIYPTKFSYSVIFDSNKDGEPDYTRVSYPIRGGFTHNRKPTQMEISYFKQKQETK